MEHCKNPKILTEYSTGVGDIYKRKILILFDDMTADMVSIKPIQKRVTELLIRDRKFNITPVFITQSYFAIWKNIRLNSIVYFIIKISNKRELRQIPINYSSYIDRQDFTNL